MDNKLIRRTMRRYIKRYGKQDTREMIAKFSSAFCTTKHRISGNISCMVCIDGSINITPDRPHSIMYESIATRVKAAPLLNEKSITNDTQRQFLFASNTFLPALAAAKKIGINLQR